MSQNEIVDVKTVQAGPQGSPIYAIMIAANVVDPSTLAPFVADLVDKFKVQRMISPPTTTHFLLSVRGETTAAAIQSLWREHVAKDQVLSTFWKMLKVADVVRAERTGPAVEQLSLL